jgi:hypothetical protein
MMLGMSDREQRQNELMQQRIDSFRDGRLPMGPVIADLGGLVDALDETPQECKDSFIEAWNVLEIAYAVGLDRQQPLPTWRNMTSLRPGMRSRRSSRSECGTAHRGSAHSEAAGATADVGVASGLFATRCR